jgi:hypothetical protein
MGLSKDGADREYDKFVDDGLGKTAVRIAGTVSTNIDTTALAKSTDINNLSSNIDEQVLWVLKRIAKLLEPVSTQDVAGRQRIIVDSAPTTAVTLASLATLTTVNQIAANDGRYVFMENARVAYATGIRNNLTF